jgi:hypothetical protein
LRIKGNLDLDDDTIRLNREASSEVSLKAINTSTATIELPSVTSLLVGNLTGGINTKRIEFDSQGAASATTLTFDNNNTASRTITFIDADMTLVGTTNDQTLTQKELTDPTFTAPADIDLETSGTVRMWDSATSIIMGQGATTTSFSFGDTTTTSMVFTIGGAGLLTLGGAGVATINLGGNSSTALNFGGTNSATYDFSSASTGSNYQYSGYWEINEVVTPATPAAGRHQIYFKSDGNAYTQNNAGLESRFGSGGGGGAGAAWIADDLGTGAQESFEFAEKVFLLPEPPASGPAPKVSIYLKVPSTYATGSQVTATLGFYSPGAANNYRVQVETVLIRVGTDAVSKTSPSETPATQFTNPGPINILQTGSFDLSDASGDIGGIAISADDLIKVTMTRIAVSSGSEDANDTRFIPSHTEVSFG